VSVVLTHAPIVIFVTSKGTWLVKTPTCAPLRYVASFITPATPPTVGEPPVGTSYPFAVESIIVA